MALNTVAAVGAVAAGFVASTLAAADLAHYRDFRLGASTAAVVKMLGTTSPRDLMTVLSRPVLLQQLEWRPRGDPVRRVVFSFVDDQLLKIVVEYEQSRTEGLTKNDMVAALSVAYGPRDPLPALNDERSGYDALDAATVIAQWRTAETNVTLQRYDYVGGYALVVTSVRLEQRARQAQAAGAALNEREAQAHAAALLRIRANAAREASERTRAANKATFTP